MKRRINITGLFLSISLLVTTQAMAEAKLQDTRELEIDAGQLAQLRINVTAGSLVVRGVSDSDRIQVSAEIWQSRANDDYELKLSRDGDSAVLVTDIDTSGGWFSFGNEDRIDVVVSVPAMLQLDIHDGSGSIEVSDIQGDVRINDGSGSIQLLKLGAAVDIDDGSGSISVVDVQGDVHIDDGSGSISVKRIGGMLDIEDGSGSISATDITGIVRLRDGSGSIAVDGAADLKLLSDGSGSVSQRNIRSDLNPDSTD